MGVTVNSDVLGQALQAAMNDHRRGDLPAAERGYRATLALQPDNADALHLLGVIRADAGYLDEGIPLIERALKIFPKLADAHFNLGNIYRRIGKMADAERHFRRAAQLQPDNPRPLANLGAVLTKLGRYDDATTAIRRTLRLDPAYIPARQNLAALHEIAGRFDETIPIYDSILKDDPDDLETRHLRALALLLRGELTDGWIDFQHRLLMPHGKGFHGQFPFPYWSGEPLAGKRILVWTERGPGDEILMGTILPDVVRAAGHVVLVCSERMAPLFARAFPTATVIPADNKPKEPGVLADVAYQASFSELGRFLRPNLAAFKPLSGYLTADQQLAGKLRASYLDGRPNTALIGISWRSRNPDTEPDKSMALADLATVLKTPAATFVSLQYSDCGTEIADVNRTLGTAIIHDDGIDPLRDLEAFAAQTAAMDLVISVSNTTVHMAAALGRPTWAMIPANRGRMWYWFLDRADSPWYGAARLFRATPERGWKPAVAEVAAALTPWLAAGQSP